jgi:hypothetical protein
VFATQDVRGALKDFGGERAPVPGHTLRKVVALDKVQVDRDDLGQQLLWLKVVLLWVLDLCVRVCV